MTPNQPELLPCPFCGGKADFERLGTVRVSCIIACEDCGCRLETGETGDHCGSAWNTRQSQAVGVEIAIQLRDALLRFDIDYDLTEGEEANIVLTKEDQDTLRAAVLALENLNATPNDSGKEGGGE